MPPHTSPTTPAPSASSTPSPPPSSSSCSSATCSPRRLSASAPSPPYEVLATPLTYLVINTLKRTEDTDAFDTHTSFNPFHFAAQSSPNPATLSHL